MIYIILFFALGLRLVSLNQSFWLDEATTALVARDMTLAQYFKNFAPGDFHPPVYYVLQKLFATGLGSSEVAIRGLSVVAGVMTIWVVYLIAKEIKLKSPNIAALLLATSGLHIYFSQEARMYVLASLFVASTIYFFVKTLKKGRVGEWLGFALSIAAAAFTHYLTLFIIPVYWLIAVGNQKTKSWWKKFLASHIILGILGVLWFPIFLKQFGGGLRVKANSPAWWNILGRTTPKEIALLPAKFMLGRISIENQLFYTVVVGLVGLVFGYLLLLAVKEFKKTKTIWLWFVFPVVVSGLVGLKLPVFSYFRLLFVLPAFYLLIAVGISKLGKSTKRIAIVFVLLVNLASNGVYLLNSKFHREDWKGLVTFVEEKKVDNSITLFVADSQMEAYNFYAPQANIAGPNALGDNYEQIWLMRYVQPLFDQNDELRVKIEKLEYKKQGEHDFNGVVVWEYKK